MPLTDTMGKEGVSDDSSNHGVNKEECVLDLCTQNLADLNNKLLTNIRVITMLKLDYNSLARFPDGFAQSVPHLKVLCANGNNLTHLPYDFGSLTSLTDVELKENELTCLPDSVQYLINLQRLYLTSNQLTSLPDDFGEMVCLEELFLDENQLTKFPPTFALMDKLRILEASHNQLCSLPKYLGNLRSLTHFSICCNKLEQLPESFSELDRLVILDISENELRTLPEYCSSQETLEKVFAGDNNLMLLPDWMGQLSEVTELCLKRNKIGGDSFHPDFGKVSKKLRRLDLSGNNLTKLPASFGELESLEWVHFGSALDFPERRFDMFNGNWLDSLPASFPQLTHLTFLRLDENHLRSLPDDFGLLCNLEYLNLAQNCLPDLPESFGKLFSLRVCQLSRNSLQLLPSTFGQLTALEDLHLDSNLIAELPKSFRDLTQLKTLDLSDNKLRKVPDFLPEFVNLKELYLDMYDSTDALCSEETKGSLSYTASYEDATVLVYNTGENPLKMSPNQIPAIRQCIEYKPRSENPQRTWRGRAADGHEYVLPVTNEGDQRESYDEEMANELDQPVSPDVRTHNAWPTIPVPFWQCGKEGSQEDEQTVSDYEDDSYQSEVGSADDARCGETTDDGGEYTNANGEASGCDDGQAWGTDEWPSRNAAVEADEENWDGEHWGNDGQAWGTDEWPSGSAAVEADEENWDGEHWGNCCQPRFSPPIPCSTHHLKWYYMCPTDLHVPKVARQGEWFELVEGQFSDASDADGTPSNTCGHTQTDADGDRCDFGPDTQTIFGVGSSSNSGVDSPTNAGADTQSDMSHVLETSPATSQSTDSFSLSAFDLHAPKIIRPEYDDPTFKEPQPEIGQFCSCR